MPERIYARAQVALWEAMHWALTAELAVGGAGLAWGPARWWSAPDLSIVRSLGVPMSVYGCWFMALGLVCAAGIPRDATVRAVGHFAAGATYLFWGGCTALTIFTGDLSAWRDERRASARARGEGDSWTTPSSC
jgi:hypothetical protein